MSHTNFSLSVPASGNYGSEFVKGSLRSSNLDKDSDFEDCISTPECDPRFYVEGYDMPEYDNDREIEEYLHELSLMEAVNEYFSGYSA